MTGKLANSFRAVSIPGFFVSPDLIFHSVVNGTPATRAKSCSSACRSGASRCLTSAELGISMSITAVFRMRNDLSTECGMHGSCTHSGARYRSPMNGVDSRKVVWESVSALMKKRWGEDNLNRLAREANIGPATAARLKAQKTSVGLNVLDQIATAFDVATWQLLVPGMQPDAMPVLMPMTQAEMEFLARIANAGKASKSS
jgi:Cro/C1-type HTH DNA-binding domain